MAGFQEVIRRLSAVGHRSISLTGGDIFCRPDLEDLLAEVARQGMGYCCNTSGLMGSKALRLLEFRRPWQIQVSLYGGPETHDRLQGRSGAHSRVLQFLAAIEALEVPTSIQWTLFEDTVYELDAVVCVAERFRQVRCLKVTPAVSVRPDADWRAPSEEALGRLWRRLVLLRKTHPRLRLVTELMGFSTACELQRRFNADPDHGMFCIIRPNGYVHPWYGLSSRWDLTHSLRHGIRIGEAAARAFRAATGRAFARLIRILEERPIADLNGILAEELRVHEPGTHSEERGPVKAV